MTEQILTQVEVDALLRGLSNGDIKTETEKAEKDFDGVRPYDFNNQEKTVRGRMPILEMLNEKFSRNVRTLIFNVIRKSVDLIPESVKAMRFDDFLRNLHVPSSLNIFSMSPLHGQGVLAIDSNLVYAVVDSYFGGDCRFHSRIEGKDFTKVEQAIIGKVVTVIFNELRETWKPVHKVDFQVVRSEMNPQFVNIIGHAEAVIVSTFKMEIESTAAKVYICLPYSSIEPIKDMLYGSNVADSAFDTRWSAALKDRVNSVPLVVTGDIGSAVINVSELMNLKVGDIIQLDKKVKEPIQIKVEGISKFNAKAGVLGTNYSLKIMSVYNERGSSHGKQDDNG